MENQNNPNNPEDGNDSDTGSINIILNTESETNDTTLKQYEICVDIHDITSIIPKFSAANIPLVSIEEIQMKDSLNLLKYEFKADEYLEATYRNQNVVIREIYKNNKIITFDNTMTSCELLNNVVDYMIELLQVPYFEGKVKLYGVLIHVKTVYLVTEDIPFYSIKSVFRKLSYTERKDCLVKILDIITEDNYQIFRAENIYYDGFDETIRVDALPTHEIKRMFESFSIDSYKNYSPPKNTKCSASWVFGCLFCELITNLPPFDHILRKSNFSNEYNWNIVRLRRDHIVDDSNSWKFPIIPIPNYLGKTEIDLIKGSQYFEIEKRLSIDEIKEKLNELL